MSTSNEMLDNHNLRIGDLIAKTARTTLRDTLRVLEALRAVSSASGKSVDEVMDAFVADVGRPNPDNVVACEFAHYELLSTARQGNTNVRKALKGVRGLM